MAGLEDDPFDDDASQNLSRNLSDLSRVDSPAPSTGNRNSLSFRVLILQQNDQSSCLQHPKESTAYMKDQCLQVPPHRIIQPQELHPEPHLIRKTQQTPSVLPTPHGILNTLQTDPFTDPLRELPLQLGFQLSLHGSFLHPLSLIYGLYLL